MLDAAIIALSELSDPMRLGFLGLGVLIGLLLGAIPGVGGLVGLSLLLPFTFSMDSYTAMAFLMGLQAVVVTSDTIPAVLFGVPGTVGSAATILDGYPMSKKGEAGRAFGAAFTASVIGGIFGAILLALTIPVIRPVIIEIGSPELLAICILGLSLVAVLSDGDTYRGLAAACIGLLLATIGDDAQTGTLRWTFDTIYLYDGLSVVPLALGLFALPEIADLVIARKPISKFSTTASKWSQLQGIKDVLNNKSLLLRCASIGSFLGALPGIGSAVIDWIAYGHAAKTTKGSELTFGKGDVRGVIASESANNAKEGGSLLPTIVLGVPGSASMALILGAFLVHGLVPGPEMLTRHLDITFTLIWSVALANILGAGICFLFANQLAKIAMVRIGILAPAVIAIVFVGAFQGHRSWGDIYALILLGLFGWTMKTLKWPRPPLVLGFVLGALIERYYFISMQRYDWEWLWIIRDGSFKPWVMIILLITAYSVGGPVVRNRISAGKSQDRPAGRVTLAWPVLDSDLVFSIVMAICFGCAFVFSWNWDLGARLFPQTIGLAGLLFIGLAVIEKMTRASLMPHAAASPVTGGGDTGKVNDEIYLDLDSGHRDLPNRVVLARFATFFAWVLFYVIAALCVGLLPAMFLYLVLYMYFSGNETGKMALGVSFVIWISSYLLFHVFVKIPWPQSLLGDALPVLRSMPAFDLF